MTAASQGLAAGSSSSHGEELRVNLLRERKDKDVYEKFEILSSIGQGSMGEVTKVRIRPDKVGGSAFETKKVVFGLKIFSKRVKTGELSDDDGGRTNAQGHVYALKSIILDRVKDPTFVQELKNEIEVLRSLDHPNIVKLYEVYSYHKQIYLVLELCEGGDLYTRSPYSEREAARICVRITSAVHYLHTHGVVHRDLKFENIMFENKSPGAQMKIIDFGLSKKFSGAPKFMGERVGTIYTMAPQILQGIYNAKADLWSIGVISYMLLCTSKPFYDKNRRRMIEKIMEGEYKRDGPAWDSISPEARDFVQRLLVVDPNRRMDAAQALQHPWLIHREQLPDEKPSSEVLASIDDALTSYVNTSALKKLALMVIAHRSTAPAIEELRRVFEEFDTSRDGVISFAELRAALIRCDFSEEDIQKVFSSVDTNKNGKINYTEFLAATIEAHGYISEDRIAEAFDRLDSDGTGYIGKSDLRNVLGERCTSEEIEAIVESGDTDHDGKVSYKEFLQAFRTSTYQHMATVTGSPPSSLHPPPPPSGKRSSAATAAAGPVLA